MGDGAGGLPAASATMAAGGESMLHLPMLGAAPVALAAAAPTAELLAARSQMAFTLGFHIILACLGVGLPTIVLIANAIGLRRGDQAALTLARRWSTVM